MWDRWGRPRGPVISEPGSPLAARTRQDTRSQRKQRTYLGRAACFSGGASPDGPGHRADAAARPPTPAHGRPLPTGRAGADEAMETVRSERRRIGTRNGYRCRRPSAPIRRAGAEPHASPRAASRGHVPVGAAFPRPAPRPPPTSQRVCGHPMRAAVSLIGSRWSQTRGGRNLCVARVKGSAPRLGSGRASITSEARPDLFSEGGAPTPSGDDHQGCAAGTVHRPRERRDPRAPPLPRVGPEPQVTPRGNWFGERPEGARGLQSPRTYKTAPHKDLVPGEAPRATGLGCPRARLSTGAAAGGAARLCRDRSVSRTVTNPHATRRHVPASALRLASENAAASCSGEARAQPGPVSLSDCW